MIEVISEMFSLKIRKVFPSFLLLALINCSASQREGPSNQWPEMQFIVDGRTEIRLIAPPARSEPGTFEPQFIFSSTESLERLFVANYDPGRGRDRDLLLTRISSNVLRLEPDLNEESSLSMDYIKNDIYLSRDDAEESFEIIGEAKFNDHLWLRVNLIGGNHRGITYSTIVDGGYILFVTMSIYGDESDQTSLYRTRHETLKTIVNSVRIYSE
jgi:hypothetical protein